MPREYASEAIVLGSRKLGESDRIVDIFTADRGRVATVVKGVRKVKSRWGGRLEPFTRLQVQLHEGRTLHTLTAADTIRTNGALRENPFCLKACLSVSEMLSRTTPEHHPKPRTYNLMIRFLEEMDELCRGGGSDGSAGGAVDIPAGDEGRSAVISPRDAAPVLALAAQLKILLLAGFLPHLTSCAKCGADTDLTGFSAAAGGSLCRSCRQGSFAMDAAVLMAMRHMLEHPLSAARSLPVEEPHRRQIRRAIREICEFHLGTRLKVDPW